MNFVVFIDCDGYDMFVVVLSSTPSTAGFHDFHKFHRRSLVLSPSLPSFFPALSLALVFARAPLSERLEQATAYIDNNKYSRHNSEYKRDGSLK